jgi:hypothetical protein
MLTLKLCHSSDAESSCTETDQSIKSRPLFFQELARPRNAKSSHNQVVLYSQIWSDPKPARALPSCAHPKHRNWFRSNSATSRLKFLRLDKETSFVGKLYITNHRDSDQGLVALLIRSQRPWESNISTGRIFDCYPRDEAECRLSIMDAKDEKGSDWIMIMR